MENQLIFTSEEQREIISLSRSIYRALKDDMLPNDFNLLKQYLSQARKENALQRNVFQLNPILHALQTAQIAIEEIGLKRDGVLAILLFENVASGCTSMEDIEENYGIHVTKILKGLVRIQDLYKKSPIIESENFRNLLLSFAEDMRVILIMIADRLNLMREIRDSEAYEAKRKVSEEASYLYAPLAHKLGLYRLKSELEDLSLKYLEHDAYYMIKEKLNATKATRDKYIDGFIRPVKERLEHAGLKFHIKGRTKSIHSIWQKMKKQKCAFEGIYDLFAIRIILDSPEDKEKMQCWQVYSIVTDMYQPNPKRLRDWLSVPKSNGYESLHITVLGPDSKWVEVQIRTERMDEIAERGLAAHWRYKGVKSEGGIDEWLNNIRSVLENNDNLQVMDQFKLDLYEDEVYVFTPKGDLFKLAKGATVLDFAYLIHSDVGNHCVGGKINGKSVQIRQALRSGDTVEIMTSKTQEPKREWLNIVQTSKAKSKIRLSLKETQTKDGLYAKELLERRFKNRKVEYSEGVLGKLIKRLGYKENSEFYSQLASGKLDANSVIEQYIALQEHDLQPNTTVARSAEEFEYENPAHDIGLFSDDVLVIDEHLKGIDYSLAKCCNPIYGDPVFGFVTISGGIKIHRTDCPNAPEMRKRFGYRIVKAQWSGKGASQYSITLRVIGNDDIGIISNITNIISKEEKIDMRSINIDSKDGLFNGNLVVQLNDTDRLQSLIRRLRSVKGVIEVTRL